MNEEQQNKWRNMSEIERELRLKVRHFDRSELKKLFWYRRNLSWVPPNQEDEYYCGFIAGIEGKTSDDNPHSFDVKITTNQMRSVIVGWRCRAWELGVESGNDHIEHELENIVDKNLYEIEFMKLDIKSCKLVEKTKFYISNINHIINGTETNFTYILAYNEKQARKIADKFIGCFKSDKNSNFGKEIINNDNC